MKTSFKKLFKFIIISLAFSGILYVVFLLASYNSRILSELHFIDDYEIVSATSHEMPTVITIKLPHKLNTGDALCFRTVHQEAHVYQRNELKYQYTKDFSDRWGKSAVSTWHTLTLNPFNNDPIRIELYSPFPGLFEYKNLVLIGNGAKFLEYITIQTSPPIFISIISIIIGSVCLLMLTFKRNAKPFYRLLLFSLLLIVTGIWSLGESRRIFFDLIPPHIDRFIYLLAFYLMPALLFFLVSTFYRGMNRNIFIVLSFACLLLTCIVAVLQVFEIRDLILNVFINLSLIVIGVLILLVLKIHSFFIKKNKSSKKTQFALSLLCIFVVFEIYNFLNGKFGNFYFYIRCILVLGAFYSVVYFITSINKQGLKLKLTQRKLALSKSNIVALKMRPHLIHNTLLSIQELCYSSPEDAVDAIGAFSKYLRSSFEITTTENLIPFSQELQYIREYINVQKICYGDEIVYIEKVEYSDFKVPPLTLQPFVENAVKHGLRKRQGIGTVTVTTKRTNKIIEICIEDDGVGFEIQNKQVGNRKSSTKHIMYRLKQLLHARINITSTVGIGSKVVVRFSKGSRV